MKTKKMQKLYRYNKTMIKNKIVKKNVIKFRYRKNMKRVYTNLIRILPIIRF